MDDNFDPYDMDKTEFNPDLFMLKIVEDSSLQQIMSKRNNLDMEISGIGAGIKSLLYDNYTKFITSSEVISKIKNDFEKMGDDIQALESKMDSIENISSQIIKSLQPTKEKRLNLIKSKENLNKLDLLVNLVPKLKEFVEHGEFAAAARHYLKAKKLLEQHKSSKSLQEIIEESKIITSYIGKKLINKLDCCVYSKEEISETMNMIIELGESDKDILHSFLLNSKDNLDNIIQKIKKDCQDGDDLKMKGETEIGNCFEYSSSYLDVVSKVVEIVQDAFSSKTITFSWISILADFVEDHTQQLFVVVRSFLKNQPGDINDECLSNRLDKLYRKNYECYSRVMKIATFEKSADAILNICKDRCDYHFRKMKLDFQAYLSILAEKLKCDHKSDDLLISLDAVVDEIVTSTLNSLCHFISPEFKYSRNVYFRKIFCKLLAREAVFAPFFQDINYDILKGIRRSQINEEVALKMCMLFMRYFQQMVQSKLWNYFHAVDERLHSSTENIILTSVSDITNKHKETAEEIIRCYIETRQRRMSAMLRYSMENKNWMMVKEPWKVSAGVRRVLEEFNATVKETEILQKRTKSPVRSKSNGSGKSAYLDFLVSGDITVDHEMFLSISNVVEFSREYILNRIMTMTLKSLLEYVRQKTFNRFGLQQIQVDVRYLELHVSKYMRDEREIDVLYDDIISSCYTRTIHPEFMNPYVVSALCQAFSI